jgi:hypothetical protein
MLLASSVSGLFKWRQFEPEVIILAVGWYLRFSLSVPPAIARLKAAGVLEENSLHRQRLPAKPPEGRTLADVPYLIKPAEVSRKQIVRCSIKNASFER